MHTNKIYLQFFVSCSVKSTIKTREQFDYRLMDAIYILNNVDLGVHSAQRRSRKTRACANQLKTTNLQLCKTSDQSFVHALLFSFGLILVARNGLKITCKSPLNIIDSAEQPKSLASLLSLKEKRRERYYKLNCGNKTPTIVRAKLGSLVPVLHRGQTAQGYTACLLGSKQEFSAACSTIGTQSVSYILPEPDTVQVYTALVTVGYILQERNCVRLRYLSPIQYVMPGSPSVLGQNTNSPPYHELWL